MSISNKDHKLLWAKSGGICAFPNCNEELIYSIDDEILGQICHIIAKKSKGPRGDINISIEKLDAYDNLILLCPTHHKIIDNDPQHFTVSKLQEMKYGHEKAINIRLKSTKLWKSNVSQLYYVNIPRLAIWAGLSGMDLQFNNLNSCSCLHAMGWDLNYILLSVEKIIDLLYINVSKFDNIQNIKEGQIVEFNNKFRTKNMPYPEAVISNKYVLKGKIDKDPQIYVKINDYKFILLIDPRWITTSTSFCSLCSGWINASGLCIIKSIDHSNKSIIASPYLIGVPKNEQLESLFT